MNLKKLQLPLILLAISLLTFACGKKGESSINHVQIPDDMHFVVSINTKSLQTKSKDISKIFEKDFLSSMDINIPEYLGEDEETNETPSKSTNTDMSKESKESEIIIKKRSKSTDKKVSDDSKETQKAVETLLKSGLDLKEKVYVFGKMSEKTEEQEVGISFVIKDAKLMESSISKILKKELIVKEEGGIKFATPKKENKEKKITIAWKGKTGLIFAANKKDVIKIGKDIFALKSEKSIFTKYKEVSEMEAKNNDIAFWIDYKQINKISKKVNDDVLKDIYNLPAMDKLGEVTTSLTAFMSFENGEAKLESEVFLDPSKSKIYENMLKQGITQSIVKNIPIQAPQIMIGFNIALKPLYELFKDSKPMKEVEENTKKTTGLSNAEFIDMLTGDLLIAFKNLKVGEAIGGKPDPEAVVVLGVAKKDLFEKMMKNGEAYKDFKKEKDYYVYSPTQDVSIYLILKDNGLYGVGSKSLRDAILQGKGKLDGEHLAMTKNNSSLMYMDFKFFEQLKGILGENLVLNLVTTEFKTLTMENPAVKNHKISSKMSLKFSNTKDNSLYVLLNMFKKVAEEENKIRKQRILEEEQELKEEKLPTDEKEEIEAPKESL
ncbi:MAG: hypothetical protein EAZ20_12080 [Bacteroidetes bacterium]|nr:MAG: hypothetical protein EAZ20_12080 [Bacteroidota bacterium]